MMDPVVNESMNKPMFQPVVCRNQNGSYGNKDQNFIYRGMIRQRCHSRMQQKSQIFKKEEQWKNS